MTSLLNSLRERFAPVKPLPAGIYTYKAPLDAPLHYRLHLRVEPDGRGVLLVNASTVLHLNATATEYAYHLVHQTPEDEAAQQIASRYRVSQSQALQDYKDLVERIETLLLIPDLDPVTYLDFDRHEPYSGNLSAPYRLDCALTYRLPKTVEPGTAPQSRVDRELTTAEWKSVLNKAWEAGIPHVTFTGGEPTLRQDLVELLNYAEDLGMVTGLLTDGQRLGESEYLDALLQAGLDHIMVVLQPDKEQSWESLGSFTYWSHALDADLYIAAHLTLTPENAEQAAAMLARLAKSEIHAVSLSASDPTLAGQLQAARDRAAELDMNLVWDLPVPYSTLNPVSLETRMDAPPEGAGRAWLYVEPDGDVLPTQGFNKVLGNILHDPWDKIWQQE
jgi:organic radical activating enzyme